MESAFHDRQRLTIPSRGGEHPNEGTSHTNPYNHTANEPLAYCILWSPLPPITFVLPFVGHLGIADSNGVASDFQGPYYVGDAGAMAFGPPTRALVVRGFEDDPDHWDGSIREANRVYRGRMHNICCDNCHSHVAFALNRAGAKAHGVERWDMVKLAALLFFKGRFLSWGAVLYQFGPFVTIVLIVVLTMRLK